MLVLGVVSSQCSVPFLLLGSSEHLLRVGNCQLTSTQTSCSLASVTVLENKCDCLEEKKKKSAHFPKIFT